MKCNDCKYQDKPMNFFPCNVCKDKEKFEPKEKDMGSIISHLQELDDSGKLPGSTRQFESGYIRDNDEDKPNYVKALSAPVIREYVEYLGKCREMPDGSKRDWDNWKLGMSCEEDWLESLDRHNQLLKELYEVGHAEDNHGPVTKKDTVYAIMFNAMGLALEIIKGEQNEYNRKD